VTDGPHTETDVVRELQASEERFKAIFRIMADAAIFTDVERRIQMVNPAFVSLFGYTAEEVIGRSAEMLYADPADFRAQGKRRYHTGEGTDRAPFEMRYRRKDGSVFWAESLAMQVREKRAEVSGFVGIHRDITARKRAEQALRANEERLRFIVENSPDNIFLQDARHRYVWVSKPAMGLTREHYIGHTDMEMAEAMGSPEAGRQLHAIKQKVMEENQGRRLDLSLDVGGKRFTFICAYEPWRDDAGNVIGLAGYVHDITERKQAEEALRESEERFRAFMTHTPAVAWMKDGQGRYVFLSKSYERRFGVRLEDWRDKTDFDLWPEEIAEVFRGNDLRVLEGGKPIDVIEQATNPDGSRSYWWNFRFPFQDGAGRRYVGGMGVDITERKRAEDALCASEERLRLAQSAAHIGLCDWHIRDGRVVWSPEMERLYGFEEDARPRDYAAFAARVHPEDQPAVERARNEAIRARNPFDFDFRVRLPSGQIRWLNCKGAGVYDGQGNLERIVDISVDITERKRLEQERRTMELRLQEAQRLESLGVLAGGIAHDFNNILMAIMGHADLALDELPPLAPARENLAEITAASKRAAELCGQMLAYAGKGRTEPRPLSLRELVEETLHMLRTGVSKKCMLSVNLEKDLPSVYGDPYQLRQVLINLVTNASEAIGDRGGTITIAAGTVDCTEAYFSQCYAAGTRTPGTYAFLEVTDTGCGIDPRDIQRIFEPFFTTKFAGRGLGLPVVLGIVRAHNGALRVRSEQGKGSTFTVILPVARGSEDTTRPDNGTTKWQGEGTILLVDDEEGVRTVCAKLLRRLGLRVLTASDGRQAVEVYRRQQAGIAAVLMDLTMPRMNGEEARWELRKINPDVRVILASGYSENEIASRFAGKGLAGHLQKPYSLAKLRSLLSGLLPEAESQKSGEREESDNLVD
jgi:PAS domain S-box-containing protein